MHLKWEPLLSVGSPSLVSEGLLSVDNNFSVEVTCPLYKSAIMQGGTVFLQLSLLQALCTHTSDQNGWIYLALDSCVWQISSVMTPVLNKGNPGPALMGWAAVTSAWSSSQPTLTPPSSHRLLLTSSDKEDTRPLSSTRAPQNSRSGCECCWTWPCSHRVPLHLVLHPLHRPPSPR